MPMSLHPSQCQAQLTDGKKSVFLSLQCHQFDQAWAPDLRSCSSLSMLREFVGSSQSQNA